MGPFLTALYSALAVEQAQKIHWVCPHMYHCSSTELAPHHAQIRSKFKSPASSLGNKDLDSVLLLNPECFLIGSHRRWSMCLSSVTKQWDTM